MKESSTVGHEKMKKLLDFYCHLLEFYCRALEFYCPVFLVIFKTGVLMSLESYCRWGSTVECNYIFLKYLKNWGSIVVGVLLFLEFFCLWSSTVSIPLIFAKHLKCIIFLYKARSYNRRRVRGI